MHPVKTPASQLTTPQILQLGLGAVCVAGLLLMLTVILGARSHRQAMQAVGRDSAPSIIAAQHIRAALADMDANAANEFLGTDTAAASRRAFEERRKEATEAIVTAAQNITYGDAERLPIHKLALGVGTYAAMMQSARDLHAAGDKHFPDEWRAGAHFMDATVLPAAADLDKANRDVLDQMYASQHSASGWILLTTVAAGLLLVGVLGAVQFFLAQRMKRMLNPLLLCATLGTIALVGASVTAFLAADHHLKTAKEDAFESIHALWQARSVSYSANGDESRYLLDREQQTVHEKAFFAKTETIAKRGANNGDGAAGELRGYLGDELKNITFAGEREAATETLARFNDYLDIDRKIREFERNGQHQAAVALCTGSKQGESNWAFERFDTALGKTLDVNQKAFDNSVEQGFAAVAGFEILAPLAALGIALLAFFGIRPRLQEYLR